MLSRYLDPKNDLAFKKIFGPERHKRIPMAFLNAIFHLEGPDEITDLEFLNTLQAPEIEAGKESIVDVLVRDQKGSKYIIEMQVAKIEGFEKRAQFYAAKTYCTHFNVGNPYHELKKVIFLAITSYVVFPGKKNYKSDHVILDNETYENDLKDFYFAFVELPKFTKEIHELETLEDKWYYFLKHAEESTEIDASLASSAEIKDTTRSCASGSVPNRTGPSGARSARTCWRACVTRRSPACATRHGTCASRSARRAAIGPRTSSK